MNKFKITYKYWLVRSYLNYSQYHLIMAIFIAKTALS